MKIFIAMLCVLLSTPSLAQSTGARIEICTPEQNIQACQNINIGSGHFDDQNEVRSCLIYMFGCRQYEELASRLLNSIDENQADLGVIQQYFLGAALYKLQLATRSEGIRCEFRTRSKDQLQGFLALVKLQFSESGNFGGTELKYIRHAATMISTLNKNKTCQESALTEKALENIADETASSQLENLFRSIDIGNPFDTNSSQRTPVNIKLDNIFRIITQFSSKASELEIASKMIATELEVNNRLITSIVSEFNTGLYNSEDGVIEDQDGVFTFPSSSTKLDSAETSASLFKTYGQELEIAKEEAFSGLESSNYAALREKYSGLAASWTSEAAFQDELRKATLDHSSMAEAVAALAQQDEDNNPFQVLIQARDDYKTRNAAKCQSFRERRFKETWYCRSHGE